MEVLQPAVAEIRRTVAASTPSRAITSAVTSAIRARCSLRSTVIVFAGCSINHQADTTDRYDITTIIAIRKIVTAVINSRPAGHARARAASSEACLGVEMREA